jgi:hypothetical protein
MGRHIERVNFINLLDLDSLLLCSDCAGESVDELVLIKVCRVRHRCSCKVLVLGLNLMLDLHKLVQSFAPPAAHIEPARVFEVHDNYFHLALLFVVPNHIIFVFNQFGCLFGLVQPVLKLFIGVLVDCLGKQPFSVLS